MKLHRLLLFFATQLIGLCLACGSPSWVRSTPSIGSLAMDGTLAKRFSLGMLRFGDLARLLPESDSFSTTTQ